MQLSESYCSIIAGVHATRHFRSASQKLASFLLNWRESNRPSHKDVIGTFNLTHEEIGQVIGTSRETVTRVLSGFKKRGLIELKGCNLVLTERAVLESLAAN